MSETFRLICELAIACGATGLAHRATCWEREIDQHWRVALNGTRAPLSPARGGPPIPAFSALLEFNGWPAGVVDPRGGVIAAGDCANEASVIAALRGAIERAGVTA